MKMEGEVERERVSWAEFLMSLPVSTGVCWKDCRRDTGSVWMRY